MLHTKLVPAGQLRKSWLAVATVLLLLVGMAFVACKDDSGETPPAGSSDDTQTGGDSSSNPFIGTWTGTATLDGESASATVTVTESGWTIVCSDADMNESGTYSRTGNTATLTQSGTTFGRASISGSTLTVSITSGDYQGGSGTFRK
jgi:hypothetical protein